LSAATPIVDGPLALDAGEAEALLRTLPEWFGIEEALLHYARDCTTLPTFAARDHTGLSGFLTLKRHFAESAEIRCIAVRRDRHGSGTGCALVAAAEHWWRAQGGRLLQVKTIGSSHPDPSYARTRRFYVRCGFIPLEEFPALWSPRHPCLQLVKPL
jgi:GNAT superfamily N-acetyltransferase